MFGIEITGIGFCAAHRVEGHPKCGRLHGHNYEVSLALASTHLDTQGFVADFGDVKRIVKEFIDDKWDHRYLVSQANLEAGDVYYNAARYEILIGDDCVVLDVPQTTAEYLARLLFDTFQELLHRRYPTVVLQWVAVRETPTSEAVYHNPDQE